MLTPQKFEAAMIARWLRRDLRPNDRRLEHRPNHVFAANVEGLAKCGVGEHDMAVTGSPHDEILLRIEKLPIVRRAIREFPMRVFDVFELFNVTMPAAAKADRNGGKPRAPRFQPTRTTRKRHRAAEADRALAV